MNIYEWISKVIPTNGTIVEAGTSEGNDTVFFSNHCIHGKVYAFEPVENLYLQALEKTKNRINIHLSNLALSDKSGTTTIFISDRFGEAWGSSSLLEPKEHLVFHPQITFKNTSIVKTITLDAFFSDKNINVIDLMWLDLQGAEPSVLKASPKTLEKVRYLYTEVSFVEMYKDVMLYKDFKVFLNQQGFEVLFEDKPYPDMGNVLFKNIKM